MTTMKHGLVDAGVHLWDLKERSDLFFDFPPKDLISLCQTFSADELERSLKKSKFRYAIHSPVTPSHEESLIASVLSEEYYFMSGYMAPMDLYDASFLHSSISRLQDDEQFLGIHIDLCRDSDNPMSNEWLLDKETKACWATLAHKQVPVDVNALPMHLRTLANIAYEYPTLQMAIKNCGNPDVINGEQWKEWCEDMAWLTHYTNVHCKIGHLIINQTTCQMPNFVEAVQKLTEKEILDRISPALQYALSCFGPDRCIYASDWPIPHVLLSHCPALQMDTIHETLTNIFIDKLPENNIAGLSPEELQKKIFRENAIKFYNLKLRSYG